MRAGAALLLATAFLAGCQTSRPTAPVVATEEADAVSIALADAMKRCWFAGDAAFAGYVYAPEIVAGSPRILILQKDDAAGRPALVVEPKTRTVVDVYGPLLAAPVGPRIRSDIDRWTKGGSECA